MRMQSSQSTCGPTALHNSLLALGIQRGLDELEIMCGCTATDGTSTKNLMRAAAKIEGCRPVLIRDRKSDIAALRLRFALQSGRPVVLVWGDGSHWVAAVGMLGERVLVADSAESELVISMEIEDVIEGWVDSGVFEGVVL